MVNETCNVKTAVYKTREVFLLYHLTIVVLKLWTVHHIVLSSCLIVSEAGEAPYITSAGFQFLLLDTASQLWYFTLQYLKTAQVNVNLNLISFKMYKTLWPMQQRDPRKHYWRKKWQSVRAGQGTRIKIRLDFTAWEISEKKQDDRRIQLDSLLLSVSNNWAALCSDPFAFLGSVGEVVDVQV